MIERLLVAFIITALGVGVYLLFDHWQRRLAAAAHRQMTALGHARLLYFHGKICGACRVQGHYLAQLDDLHRALVEPIDVEQSPELARQYKILTLPTTVLIDPEGKVRYLNPGVANPLKLTRQLEDVMNIPPGPTADVKSRASDALFASTAFVGGPLGREVGGDRHIPPARG